MSKARLVITAVITEGRSAAEVAAAYEVSRSWVYELMARYRAEGQPAFAPPGLCLHDPETTRRQPAPAAGS